MEDCATMTLGEKIKYLRKEKGLTQSELADLLGVTKGAISQYEKELNKPSYEILVSIAKHLGSSVDELLASSDDAGSIRIGSGSKNINNSGHHSGVANTGKVRHIGPAAGRSLTDELERLAELRKQELLTEEEFRKAKQRLLDN